MDYNTSLSPLILKEYGRNIQKLVEYLRTIEDVEKRTEQAHTLVDLMKQLSPANREAAETNQKLWDDLYIMANFDIELENPFPIPEKDTLTKKPDRVPYQSNRIKYKHYGRNIELLINEAIAKEDPQEREDAVIYIGKLMKSFYGSWNKEIIDDAVILENMVAISGGKLNIDLDKVKEDNLFEKLYKNKKRSTRPTTSGKSGGDNRKGGNNNNNRRRRRN